MINEKEDLEEQYISLKESINKFENIVKDIYKIIADI